MKLGVQVGLGSGHIVLDGDPAPLPQKGRASPQFSAHIYCAHTAGWIMALGVEVGLSPGHIVLDGDPGALLKRGQSPPLPNFRPISIVSKWLDASRCHLVWRLASA